MKLKPLVWIKEWAIYTNGFRADTLLGRYHVGNDKWHFANYPASDCKSLEEAKEQAWQHYESQIRSLYEDT